MKLPKRKHDGCDDMCAECVEWMHRVEELMKPVAHEAMKAFWNVVYASAPSLPANLPSAHTVELFTLAAEEATGDWAVENLFHSEVKVTADGRPIKKALRFEPMSKEPQPESVFLPFK